MSNEYCHACERETQLDETETLLFEGHAYCDHCYVDYIIKEAGDRLKEIKALRDELVKYKRISDAIEAWVNSDDDAEFDGETHPVVNMAIDIDRLNKENAELKEQLRWRTWPDEKPEVGQICLVKNDLDEKFTAEFCFSEVNGWWLSCEAGDVHTDIAEWLPIPKEVSDE